MKKILRKAIRPPEPFKRRGPIQLLLDVAQSNLTRSKPGPGPPLSITERL